MRHPEPPIIVRRWSSASGRRTPGAIEVWRRPQIGEPVVVVDATNGPELHPVTEELANGKNFAAVTTVVPSGRFQTHMLWVASKDGTLVLNTETQRTRYLGSTRHCSGFLGS